MRIGRSPELSVDRVCHEYEVMREVDANETSGELYLGHGLVSKFQHKLHDDQREKLRH